MFLRASWCQQLCIDTLYFSKSQTRNNICNDKIWFSCWSVRNGQTISLIRKDEWLLVLIEWFGFVIIQSFAFAVIATKCNELNRFQTVALLLIYTKSNALNQYILSNENEYKVALNLWNYHKMLVIILDRQPHYSIFLI